MVEPIQLLTVENITNRKRKPTQQTLSFLLRVTNLEFLKQVDIFWSGQDQIWHTLSAAYLGQGGNNHEYWQADISFQHEINHPLPGNIQFAVRLRCQSKEYWDNNHGGNYISPIGSGVTFGNSVSYQNLTLSNKLEDGQEAVEIKFAIQAGIAEKVVIHWTIDNWRHSHRTTCRIRKQLSHPHCQVWAARIIVGKAFSLQYSICLENRQGKIWDNHHGNNYIVSHQPLNVLILNLHCYQEDHQDSKFTQIAKAIDELKADVVCFQEVAENWNHGEGDWGSNSANIINQRLRQHFNLYTDWSHLGFDRYREGVAILSRYPLHHTHSRYVSGSSDIYSIHSRKVVMAAIKIPYLGEINFFSTHLSWWEDGFQQQMQNLHQWAHSLATPKTAATLLCGDFNIEVNSSGYRLITEHHHYQDQYLQAHANKALPGIFRKNPQLYHHHPADHHRIDYIFMNKNAHLSAISASQVFTEKDYGRVSDHCGYLITFVPK